MNLWTLAGRNLRARRARSLLTVLGIALAVGAVVTLSAIAWGFEASWQHAFEARGGDAIVTRASSRNALPSPFDAAVAERLRARPEVAEVAGLLSELLAVDDAPPMFVFGWQHGSFLWQHLRLVEGRWARDDGERAVVLGRLAAELSGHRPGDRVHVELGEYEVVGIFESPAMIENGAMILTLTQMQQALERPGKVNVLNVRFRDDAGADAGAAFREAVRRELPGFMAVESADLVQQNVMVRLAKAMSWAVTLLAVLIGGAGVFNTMLMSVFERTREFALLLAVGWRARRILRLVLWESLMLSAAGALGGWLLGWLGLVLVESLPIVHGKIEGHLTPGLVLYALALALSLGLLGGLYPAAHAARLRPAAALHAE